MSYNIRNVREISNEPLTKFTNQLAKKVSKSITDQQTEKLENKEDIYSNGQDIDVVLRLKNLLSTKSFGYTEQYVSAFEPDDTYLALWLIGMSLSQVRDQSASFRQDGIIYGDPVLIDGTPMNWGINQNGSGFKSLCLSFNRPGSELENNEYIVVPDNETHKIFGITTGISYFIRFRLSSIAQQNGRDRTLFEKIDGDTPMNGVQVHVSPSGELIFHLKRDSVEYNKKTDAGTITTNTIYDVWFTYANSGNVQKVYVNNVDKSLSAASSPSWHFTKTNHDITIFHVGAGSNDGFVAGDFYDFRIYREKVITAAEVGYHYTNKWTIADIPFGLVMVGNFWATYDVGPQAAYTTTGYTSIGYNT